MPQKGISRRAAAKFRYWEKQQKKYQRGNLVFQKKEKEDHGHIHSYSHSHGHAHGHAHCHTHGHCHAHSHAHCHGPGHSCSHGRSHGRHHGHSHGYAHGHGQGHNQGQGHGQGHSLGPDHTIVQYPIHVLNIQVILKMIQLDTMLPMLPHLCSYYPIIWKPVCQIG